MTGVADGVRLQAGGSGRELLGLAARFPPSFPAPEERTGAGGLPCGFTLMMAGWRQTPCMEEKTTRSCVFSLQYKPNGHHVLAHARAGPNLLPSVSCSPCSAQVYGAQNAGLELPNFSVSLTIISYACPRYVLAAALRIWRLRRFESPDDSQHLL